MISNPYDGVIMRSESFAAINDAAQDASGRVVKVWVIDMAACYSRRAFEDVLLTRAL